MDKYSYNKARHPFTSTAICLSLRVLGQYSGEGYRIRRTDAPSSVLTDAHEKTTKKEGLYQAVI